MAVLAVVPGVPGRSIACKLIKGWRARRQHDQMAGKLSSNWASLRASIGGASHSCFSRLSMFDERRLPDSGPEPPTLPLHGQRPARQRLPAGGLVDADAAPTLEGPADIAAQRS